MSFVKATFVGKNSGGPSPAFKFDLLIKITSILAIKDSGDLCEIIIEKQLEESINRFFFQSAKTSDTMQRVTISKSDFRKITE